MAFSGGVKLGDLDDFLAPSQDCVKPLIEATGGGGPAKLGATDARGPPPAPEVQRPNLIRSKKSKSDPKAEIGQVTLSDCLACSGCVTSAETVLLQQQSGEEFLKRAAEAAITVVSVSGEVRTSIASHWGEAPLTTIQKLTSALQQLGATYVLESSASEAMALLEGKAEFIRRFRGACRDQSSTQSQLPLLTSHCPGWTCYAEKVVDPSVLPHLIPIRPPQQIQGRLVKTCLLEAHNRKRLYRWWRARSPLFAAESWWWLHSHLEGNGVAGKVATGCSPLSPQDVYHVSVQPCFDRKIEASRPQFEAPDASGVREVDTVLTATELLDLVKDLAPEASAADEGEQVDSLGRLLPVCSTGSEALTDLLLGNLFADRPVPLVCPVKANAGSGGFIEHVFREAAAELFQLPTVSPLQFRNRQNDDMREVLLEDPKSKRVLLKFVSAYGFRNIQNVMRRLTKSGTSPQNECGHFVEIMACPGGCLNGGGQIPAPKKPGAGTQSGRKDRLNALEALHHSGHGVAVVPPAEHPLMLPLYRYISSRAVASASTETLEAKRLPLKELIGGVAARSWLSAQWKSLKVDDEGKAVVGASVLKW
mmetsp:Transcript_48208/g.90292  ORF Transcript_48208/g.90292 Transcript_48208/m.90292 type:complete len:592 (-) Transcript_48208:51-1826(-)